MPASCLSGFLGNSDILGFLGNLMSVQAAARQGARIYTFLGRRRGYEGAGMLFSPAAARSAPELEQRQSGGGPRLGRHLPSPGMLATPWPQRQGTAPNATPSSILLQSHS
jgi:hypothetical protein